MVLLCTMQLTGTKQILTYTFIFSITVCLIFPLTASAQVVNIPDANLRAAIETALGKAPNASITKAEIATLQHLEAENVDIRNLKGLEAATNLEEVRLNHNLISDLSPLAGLLRLRTIRVGDNTISDLSPLAELISLEVLDLWENLISDLSPLSGLINLRSINISDNVVVDLSPLSGLIRLDRIRISRNPIGDLAPLTGLISLTHFHSWGTPILNLSALVKLPKLRVIDICGGELSDLSPLAGLTHLKELYLAGNGISDLSPLASLTGLTRIGLDNNQISDVSPLASLSSLTWIDLADNEILDFSPLKVFPENVTIIWQNNPGFTRSAPKIEGPWLWVIVPTRGMSGAQAAASGTDFLGHESGGTVTEFGIARQGATAGDAVGDKVWTLSKISRRGGNNINELVNATGLGTGNIDYHVAYGSLNLESPREQPTTMFVGASDAVKVWLNGRLIHSKTTEQDADDFQDNFPVTLKPGKNTLLVAVYEGEGWWSGFFGFDAGAEYTVWTQSPLVFPKPIRVADVNEDGFVTILDLILVARDFERNKPINPRTDINRDGTVNILDVTLIARNMDATIPAAPATFVLNNQISPAMIRSWIAQARVESNGSLVFQEAISNLQRLLASLIPEKTALFANYPNPFNPETWIPYQLAESANVTLHIYAVSGILVRSLDLGHQPAGRYQDQSRAAYWDGRNQVGEPVASGIYFYTLTAGDFTATRKMLIRK